MRDTLVYHFFSFFLSFSPYENWLIWLSALLQMRMLCFRSFRFQQWRLACTRGEGWWFASLLVYVLWFWERSWVMLVPHLKRSVFFLSASYWTSLPFFNSVPSVEITDILEVVCRHVHWQEVSIHKQCVNPRSHSDWDSQLHQDDTHYHCPTGLPSLCPKVPAVSWIMWIRFFISCGNAS
jgi:hypothetical protein